MKQLKEILKGISDTDRSAQVVSVTADSREVRPGSVFVAIRGGSTDGHRLISTAIQAGAIAVVGEDDPSPGVPYFQVSDSRSALARLSANFYDNPSHSMKMIGVTGTSGKTTLSYLLESILSAAGEKVGVVGTVNIRFCGKTIPATHTTPGAPELQRALAEMKNGGCTAVVMEVTSHALKQHRVGSISFDGMAFTNLSPEHQDFHPDMEDYFDSKAILFRELAKEAVLEGKNPVAAINVADPYGERLAREIAAAGVPRLVEFGRLGGLVCDLSGISGNSMGMSLRSELTGNFNCSNIEAAVALARGLGVPAASIERGIRELANVPGRLEKVPNSHGIHVWVDYAHKSDALDKVLATLQHIKGTHRLLTVFGCGGDRDRKKRPVMGRIAVERSDRVYITSDNPRTENPNAIIQEILAGLAGFSNFTVEPDRRKAIFQAVREAQPGDLLLIAGKGHEDYQILGTQKIHFDDREQAREALDSLTRPFENL